MLNRRSIPILAGLLAVAALAPVSANAQILHAHLVGSLVRDSGRVSL